MITRITRAYQPNFPGVLWWGTYAVDLPSLPKCSRKTCEVATYATSPKANSNHIYPQRTSLSELLFIVDNLAYFPYQVLDEPLFIIHHIDIMISVTGSNLLQSFREVKCHL